MVAKKAKGKKKDSGPSWGLVVAIVIILLVVLSQGRSSDPPTPSVPTVAVRTTRGS